MKQKLCLVLLLLVVCVTAKDLSKLKRLKTLTKQEKGLTTAHTVQHGKLKVTEMKCYPAEIDTNDPRVLDPKIKSDTAPVTQTAPDADSALKDWESVTTPAFFPNIDRGAVIGGVRKRLDNPARIQQGSAPVCGPASITFWLVVRRPYTYIKVARALYETGTYTDDINTSFTITVSDKHKNAQVGHNMDPVDWIVLIALRTTANAILDVDQFGDLWGLTTPGEMVGWTKNLLSFANAVSKGDLIGDQADVLRAADNAVNGDDANGVASLLIDASVIPGDSTIINIPNHWIAYVGGLQITDATVSFRAFTWGRLCDISATKSDWQGKGFGVIYGSSPGPGL